MHPRVRGSGGPNPVVKANVSYVSLPYTVDESPPVEIPQEIGETGYGSIAAAARMPCHRNPSPLPNGKESLPRTRTLIRSD